MSILREPHDHHARTYKTDHLAIDLPNEDAPTPMNRVNKPLERSSLPRSQVNPVLCELLECLHGRLQWQRIVIRLYATKRGERPRSLAVR
jgi:hypothetical protein